MKFIYSLLAISFFLAVTLTDWSWVYVTLTNPSEDLLAGVCGFAWLVFSALCAGLSLDFFEKRAEEEKK